MPSGDFGPWAAPAHRMPPAALGKLAGLTVWLTLCPQLECGDREMGQTEPLGPDAAPSSR